MLASDARRHLSRLSAISVTDDRTASLHVRWLVALEVPYRNGQLYPSAVALHSCYARLLTLVQCPGSCLKHLVG
jgi:hypothetical protein